MRTVLFVPCNYFRDNFIYTRRVATSVKNKYSFQPLVKLASNHSSQINNPRLQQSIMPIARRASGIHSRRLKLVKYENLTRLCVRITRVEIRPLAFSRSIRLINFDDISPCNPAPFFSTIAISFVKQKRVSI